MAQLTLVIMLPSQVTLEIIITSQASYFQGISDLVPFRYMVDPSFSFYPFFILRFYCRYDLFFLLKIWRQTWLWRPLCWCADCSYMRTKSENLGHQPYSLCGPPSPLSPFFPLSLLSSFPLFPLSFLLSSRPSSLPSFISFSCSFAII